MVSRILPSAFCPRGQAPFVFEIDSERQWRGLVRSIPGVQVHDAESLRVRVPWDLVPTLSRLTGSGPQNLRPQDFRNPPDFYRGSEKFSQLGFGQAFRSRAFQVPAVQWLASRDYGILSLALRGGKSICALGAGVLRGAEKFVIFCPAFLRPTWLYEIAKWLGSDVRIVTLNGRGSDKGFEQVGFGKREKIKGFDALKSKMLEADVILCGYEILNSQTRKTGAGEATVVPHLLGAGPILSEVPVDCLILDESQEIAGHLATGNKEWTRGDILAMIYGWPSQAKIAYALSATPLGSGSPLKVWQTFRILAGRNDQGFLWGSSHWSFSVRYAGGGKVPNVSGYGPPEVWEEGKSLTNPTEYKSRWSRLVYHKTAEELSSDMPKVMRQVIRIDGSDRKWRVPKNVTSGHGKQTELMIRAANYKAEAFVHEAEKALREGKKIQVMTLHVEPYEKALATLQRLAKSWKGDMPPRVYGVTGTTPSDVRKAYADAAMKYPGPVAFVCTAKAIRGGLSLGGINEVHTLEIPTAPDLWIQAEGRGRELGQANLASLIYVVAGSYDERALDLVLPRLEILSDVEGSKDAEDLSAKLEGQIKSDLDGLFAEMAGSVSDEAI